MNDIVSAARITPASCYRILWLDHSSPLPPPVFLGREVHYHGYCKPRHNPASTGLLCRRLAPLAVTGLAYPTSVAPKTLRTVNDWG